MIQAWLFVTQFSFDKIGDNEVVLVISLLTGVGYMLNFDIFAGSYSSHLETYYRNMQNIYTSHKYINI
jgi:hypothetical protein